MWGMFVVPVHECDQLSAEPVALHWRHDLPRAFVFHGSDRTLDDCDAAVLSNSTVSRRANASAFHPTPECVAVEDAVAVADNISGCGAGAVNRAPKERADCATVRAFRKDADVHDPT